MRRLDTLGSNSALNHVLRDALRVTGAVAGAIFWCGADAAKNGNVTLGAIVRDTATLPHATWNAADDHARRAIGNATTYSSPGWIAVPITRDEDVIGALVVAAPGADLSGATVMLEMVAARVAPLLLISELEDAERRSRLGRGHAHRHLALLAQGSRALGKVIDDEDRALDALARVVTSEFADWCAIDRVRDGIVARAAFAHTDPEMEAKVSGLLTKHDGWSDPVARVIATGKSVLSWDIATDTVDAAHLALAGDLGLRSILIVPIRVQGLSIGAITCGTHPDRRGYRQSDVEAVEELAARTATAIERISLYLETQRAAAEAAERAAQLRRLNTAALAIQSQQTSNDVARVLADQACALLGAAHADVTLSAPAADRADRDDADGVMELRVSLHDRAGRAIGTLTVDGPARDAFRAEDESMLVALAQTASLALEKVRLYETVRAGEARLLALIDTAPVAVIELDPSGAVVRANTAALQLLGDGDQPHHPETLALLAALAADACSGHPILGLEAAATRNDGTEVPLLLAAAVLRNATDDVDGIVVMASDLTARRQLEDQLVRAQRIEAVGQVAGGVAHDFNNLLTVILGHATLLGAMLPDDDEMANDVQAIAMAAERAAGVTSQLLTISRGDLVPTEVFNPRERMVRLSETLRSLLPSSIELDIAMQDGALVRMSPAQFDQVALNLAINGRDAMAETGTLTVRLAVGDVVEISVRDTGAGMDPETARRCFEPFFSTKGGERGTGLGLATVQSVVTGVGGTVTVDSTIGVGSTFTVRLPLVSGVSGPASITADSGRDGESAAGGSERILLVEDQDGLRRLAVEVLRSSGYVVVPAANGQVALDLVEQSEPIDLLITDVVMPRMGGVELAERLRATYPHLPVVFMTGYVDQASREGLHDADVLIKPFVITELAERVRSSLDRASQTSTHGSKR